MALRLAFAALVAPGLRRALARGQRAVVRLAAIAAVLAAGVALLLASGLLALSQWLGPIAATGIGGLTLVLVAGAVAYSGRGPRPLPPDARGADMPGPGHLLLPGLMLAVGFALTSQVFGKRR